MLDADPRLVPVGDAVASVLERVQQVFDDALACDLPPVMQLVRHVERYRGKMLRPTLVLVSALASHPQVACASDLAELVTPEHIAVAAVCEMVHMATLVHDDVLDDADTRRRGRTVNRLHGNETAVILGDYLIATAYHLCAKSGTPLAARAIGRASAIMCAGELLQLHHRDDYSLDEATYYEIVDRKTAELIATAAELGASLSGAGDPVCEAMARYGRCVGIAFQIQDDLLDLIGSESTVGKSVGKDLEKGKLTLPLIRFLATSEGPTRGKVLALIERACDESNPSQEAAGELALLLTRSESIGYARDAAMRYVDAAKRAVAILPESSPKAVLLAMADGVITRAF